MIIQEKPAALSKMSYLCFITGNRLYRELDVGSFEYGVLLKDVLL